ncbi:nucleotidyltransferase family protein [Candidatus Halocynthiibacter alkanivorans]|uniref:nucleotidyltransferase family protein n=1 Tax=Candidatus Halocynthiibacter alkanivorans TaxID=2267619 RepID=UPI000DF15FE9|nr:nucleotidyltransferase family protein [Candidatus Halocynthiibacter alkanivorans]
MWNSTRPAFFRFPGLGWAWPKDRLDSLIYAAIAPDQDQALAHFKPWLTGIDLNDMGFREHRLLTAISARFGNALAGFPEYPRLVGLQRNLWTKSRMALRDTVPVLRLFADNGIPVMLLKGAARLALCSADQKARVSHDLDVLVPPSHIDQALALLGEKEWHGSSGESHHCIIARSNGLRAMNFFGGRFGDIDLHQWAYGFQTPMPELETALWDNAVQAEFFGVQVLVPAASDRIALAIFHSAYDAHNHSDWLIDCAHYLRDPELDWGRLSDTIAKAGINFPAAVAFSYLNARIGLPIDRKFSSRLQRFEDTGIATKVAGVLEAKPQSDWTPSVRLARRFVKSLRLRRQVKPATRAAVIKGKFGHGAEDSTENDQNITFLAQAQPGKFRFDITVDLDVKDVPRRYEFELNSEARHLTRLNKRTLVTRQGRKRLRFSGTVTLTEQDSGLWLEARPGRYLYPGVAAKAVARYGTVPFRLVEFQLKAQ